MSRYTSRDGLMSSSDPAAVALWEDITARHEFAKMSWTDILRARGVKYAHPDDGWVNRERNRHTRSWYPQYDDHPEVGDLIAFGCPPGAFYDDTEGRWYHSGHDRPKGSEFRTPADKPECAASGYRICRVIKVERRSSVLGYHQSFEYEDTGERMPPRKPGRWRLLSRVRRS